MTKPGALALRSLVVALASCVALPAIGQTRRMEQDPNRDNLVHADDYRAGPPAELGRVTTVGEGPQDMILIAGAGFGGEVFDGFMESRRETHTMYAITLPGFGGTAAPPMPPPGTSYGEQSWTRGAKEANERLIDERQIERPIVVAHWLIATQVALRLALDNPDTVAAVIVISGAAHGIGPGEWLTMPLEQRVLSVDTMLSERWFKTVTPDTWHDNNYLPGDYARHPVRGLQLWRVAAEPPLPVWIRYLCEFWAQDVKAELERLATPTLLVVPGFDDPDYWVDPENPYMTVFTRDTWQGVEEVGDHITMETVPGSRLFIMDDEPERLDETIARFLAEAWDG